MRHALLVLLLFFAANAAPAEPQYVIPKDPAAEYGNGLSKQDAGHGWIALFDGATTFGWTDAMVRGGAIVGGATTSAFAGYEVRENGVGNEVRTTVHAERAAPIRLDHRAAIDRLCIRPLLPESLTFSPGNWKVIPHPTLPRNRQATWEPMERNGRPVGIRAVGGPGCVELPGRYSDFVLQVEVNCRKPLSNAGVFFRSRPADFLNGYEMQVFNGCVDGDVNQPARYATGAIDKRQNGRRLVSRDGEAFVMTVVASGPHFATWVNGIQVTDWTDTRPANDNPREGSRLEPGAIQLQAHDKGTDVEFWNIRVAPLK